MKGLELGQRATITHTFTKADIDEYVALTDDVRTALDEEREQRPIVPEPLLGGLFSYLLGTELPGRGTNWLKQQLRFQQPARVGDALTATVEITRLRPEKELVNLKTICRNAAGDVVCDGEVLVLVRDVEKDAST